MPRVKDPKVVTIDEGNGPVKVVKDSGGQVITKEQITKIRDKQQRELEQQRSRLEAGDAQATDQVVRQMIRRLSRRIERITEAREPGKPPSSHVGLLKKFIFFGFDTVRRSVVIGPMRLSQKGRGEAPSVLEYGGVVRMRAGRREGKRKKARIRPRPFMGPAMEKEKDQLPALWRDSVK